MSTSLRSLPDTRPIFLLDPSVDPLLLMTFVPGAILHAAELNGLFASVLPLTGGDLTGEPQARVLSIIDTSTTPYPMVPDTVPESFTCNTGQKVQRISCNTGIPITTDPSLD